MKKDRLRGESKAMQAARLAPTTNAPLVRNPRVQLPEEPAPDERPYIFIRKAQETE